MFRLYSFLLTASLCITIASAGLCADDTRTHSVGYRVWFADWESSGNDLGNAPLHMLYYGTTLVPDVSILFLAGIGSGWGQDGVLIGHGEADRLDLQVSVARTYANGWGIARLGVGYHYIGFSFKDLRVFNEAWSDGDGTMHGPEISAMVYCYLGGVSSGWGAQATATALPFVFYDLKSSRDSDDGTTQGYSIDVGILKNDDKFSFSAGYRIFSLLEDGDSRWSIRIEETFRGIYLQAGTTF